MSAVAVDEYVEWRKCDDCGGQTLPIRTVRIPRPSDPHDLCGILWLCSACCPESSDTAKTEDEWDEYIESPEAMKAGHWWLT